MIESRIDEFTRRASERDTLIDRQVRARARQVANGDGCVDGAVHFDVRPAVPVIRCCCIITADWSRAFDLIEYTFNEGYVSVFELVGVRWVRYEFRLAFTGVRRVKSAKGSSALCSSILVSHAACRPSIEASVNRASSLCGKTHTAPMLRTRLEQWTSTHLLASCPRSMWK